MAKALGVGGIFFKSPDPARLQGWYAQYLGINSQNEQGMSFAIFQPGMMPENGYTVWSMFDSGTTYFAPSSKEFMFNLMVDDLDGMLARAAEHGVTPVRVFPDEANGRFAHLMDPDGRKIELWEPRPFA